MKSPMERTQVYLPADLKKRIKRYARLSHTNLSEIMRSGAELVLAQQAEDKRQERARKAFRAIAGIWKDRDDIDFSAIREQGNHRFPEWSKRP